jgi:hypothetical protein
VSKTDKPAPGWFRKAEMSAVFNVSIRTFDQVYRRYASPSATKQFDGKPWFHARSMLDAWSATQNKTKGETSTDPLLVGDVDSPALEEYRRARARLAWMEVNEREKTHLPLASLEPALMQLTGLMRRAGERLARQHGNDAAAVLNEAIEQWESSLETLLTNEPDAAAAEADRAEHPHAPTADDARVR